VSIFVLFCYVLVINIETAAKISSNVNAEKCNLVSAKAFFKILNFAEFEIEEQGDDNCFAKH